MPVSRAVGDESLSDLQARMSDIQAELDASTAKWDAAHAKEEQLRDDVTEIEAQLEEVQDERDVLQEKAAKRARELYVQGNSGMLEVLFQGASDVADLASRAEMLSRVSLAGSNEFIALARAEDRLSDLTSELKSKSADVSAAEKAAQAESDKLQAQLDSVSDDYVKLQARLGSSAPAATQTQFTPTTSAPQTPNSKGMFCPVGGPVSFTDTWGAPRSGGRSHEGVDMMAAMGTPEIAITSGTITYAGYSSLGGNVMYLSGDDGNLYVYIHSATQESGGHFQAGDQIGTVGDTGNAQGMPHLHFEYHPGGGGPVDPTPLAASVC
jgi:murein DD-endopeptidase MepM/ murein hydrolase activator NlpD